MSHWGTPNTTVNRTCPLRRVVRVEVRDKGWATEHFDCGHSWPNYAIKSGVGKRRRCIECRKAKATQAEVA